MAGVRVTGVDRIAKEVYCADGQTVAYDTLLIATGSRPFIPPLDGLATSDGGWKPGVFTFRTLDDCDNIASYATESHRVAVIGSGLLGLEAARGLLDHGCEVHVIHLGRHLMGQQLDAQAGAILKTSMEELGIHVHLQKGTTAILGKEQVTGLAFKDGTTLDCDMVVIAAGIKPNAELALRCGLSVERAIMVDDRMRTLDDPNVYAVGECVQHRGQVYGLVAPIWEQTQVLADHLTTRNPNAAYHGSRLATQLKVMGVELASMGITQPEEDV